MIAGLTFNHHGLALRDDAQAILFLQTLGYAIDDLVHDPVQDVRLRLCTHEHLPAVEIVMPGDGPGPLDGILSRTDTLLYHSCYEVEDRQAVLEMLEDRGLRVFDMLQPTPAILFGNRKVSFHTIVGYGLIELLDRH
ncbi:MAG: methylmalonyl-CoA epimerase [Bradyrhizobium sp.]|nr:methylmalonyl-CoA epimerase [Bradyrhizobium sp.]